MKGSLDQKLRLRNFDARHGKIESGAVVKNRKGLSDVEGGKGICHQWKEKGQCSQGDRCRFRHETQDRAQKPEHTVATPSEPSLSRGRSVSRTRSIRGKSNHGSILRQPCRYYLKGTCARTCCDYWHPPECQFFKNATGCKAGDKCLFPHYKVDEQPNKKPKKSNIQKRRESDDKNAVAVAKSVSQMGCVSQDSDALVSQGRKSRGNPMQKVLNATQRARFTKSTLRHASIPEKKGPSLGKTKVKVPHHRSPYAMKFQDRFHEETERQQRCARSKAWNLAINIYKLEEKDKAAFYFPAEEWVLRAASTKEPEEREFAVDSGASMHMVSKKDLDPAELETMRTSRSPTTVMTANGEVQTREEATVYVKQLDLFVKVMLLEETNSRGALIGENSVRTMGIHTTGSAVKNHISPKMARELIAKNRAVYHLLFLVYRRVLPQLHIHLLLHHLHHRIPFLMTTDTPKIQYQKEVEVRVESFGETRCMKRQKPKTKIKIGNRKKYKEIYRMNCLIGCKNSGTFG